MPLPRVAKKSYLKAKAWTASGNTLELEGGISDALFHVMFAIEDLDKRQALITRMQTQLNEEIIERGKRAQEEANVPVSPSP